MAYLRIGSQADVGATVDGVSGTYSSGDLIFFEDSLVFHPNNDLYSILEHDTSGVLYFSNMFMGCTNLEEIPLLDTSAGEYFGNMFNGCTRLKEIPLLNTSSGVSFNGMFAGCTELRGVAPLDVSSGFNFSTMFENCISLTYIPKLDTSNGGNLIGMFKGCSSLAYAYGLDTSSATSMTDMFTDTPFLTNPDSAGLATLANGGSYVFDTKYIRFHASGNYSLEVDGFTRICTDDTVINFENTLSVVHGQHITSVDEHHHNTSGVVDFSGMFKECQGMTYIPLIDTSSGVIFDDMFYDATSLRVIPPIDTSNATSMARMFYGNYTITELPMLDTSNVRSLLHTFNGCVNLEIMPALNTSNVINFNYTFANCGNLKVIPTLDMSSGTSFVSTFRHCRVEELGDLNTVNGVTFTDMFYSASALRFIGSLNTLAHGNTGSEMSWMFAFTNALEHPTDAERTLLRQGYLYQYDYKNAALLKIAKYADDQITEPTLADYEHAEVSGVTSDVLSPLNIIIAGLAPIDVDTTSEIQVLVDDVIANIALSEITDYADYGQVTPPSILTYETARITGVVSSNLKLVNSSIRELNAAQVDTTIEVQSIVDQVNADIANAIAIELARLDALKKISKYAYVQTNAPTPADYSAVVTGVNSSNINSINEAVASRTSSELNTQHELQLIVDEAIVSHDAAIVAQAALSVISTYADSPNTATAPTEATFLEAGVTGVTGHGDAYLRAIVAGLTTAQVDTLDELQLQLDLAISADRLKTSTKRPTYPRMAGDTVGEIPSNSIVIIGSDVYVLEPGTIVDPTMLCSEINDESVGWKRLGNYAEVIDNSHAISNLYNAVIGKAVHTTNPDCIVVTRNAVWTQADVETYLEELTSYSSDDFIDSITSTGGLGTLQLTAKLPNGLIVPNTAAAAQQLLRTDSTIGRMINASVLSIDNSWSHPEASIVPRRPDSFPLSWNPQNGIKSIGVANGMDNIASVYIINSSDRAYSATRASGSNEYNSNQVQMSNSISSRDFVPNTATTHDADLYNGILWSVNKDFNGATDTTVTYSNGEITHELVISNLLLPRIVACAQGAYVTGYKTVDTGNVNPDNVVVVYFVEFSDQLETIRSEACIFNAGLTMQEYTKYHNNKILPAFFVRHGNVGQLRVPIYSGNNPQGYEVFTYVMSNTSLLEVKSESITPNERYKIAYAGHSGDVEGVIESTAMCAVRRVNDLLPTILDANYKPHAKLFILDESLYIHESGIHDSLTGRQVPSNLHSFDPITNGALSVVDNKLRTLDISELTLSAVDVRSISVSGQVVRFDDSYNVNSGPAQIDKVKIFSLKDRANSELADCLYSIDDSYYVYHSTITKKEAFDLTPAKLLDLSTTAGGFSYDIGNMPDADTYVDNANGWLPTLLNYSGIMDPQLTATVLGIEEARAGEFDYIGLGESDKPIYVNNDHTNSGLLLKPDEFGFIFPVDSSTVFMSRKTSGGTYQQRAVDSFPVPHGNTDLEYRNLSTIKIGDLYYSLVTVSLLGGYSTDTILVSFRLGQVSKPTAKADDLEYKIYDWQILSTFHYPLLVWPMVTNVNRNKFSIVAVGNNISVNVLDIPALSDDVPSYNVMMLEANLYTYNTVTNEQSTIGSIQDSGRNEAVIQDKLRELTCTGIPSDDYDSFHISGFSYTGYAYEGVMKTTIRSDASIHGSVDIALQTGGTKHHSLYTDFRAGGNSLYENNGQGVYFPLLVQNGMVGNSYTVEADGKLYGIMINANENFTVSCLEPPKGKSSYSGVDLRESCSFPNVPSVVTTRFPGSGYGISYTDNGPVAVPTSDGGASIEFNLVGSADLFYPVLIPKSVHPTGFKSRLYSITRSPVDAAVYSSTNRYSVPAEFGNEHVFGLNLSFNWYQDSSYANGDQRVELVDYESSFASGISLVDSTNVVRGTRDGVIVLLRGGATYTLQSDSLTMQRPLVYRNKYTESSTEYAPSLLSYVASNKGHDANDGDVDSSLSHYKIGSMINGSLSVTTSVVAEPVKFFSDPSNQYYSYLASAGETFVTQADISTAPASGISGVSWYDTVEGELEYVGISHRFNPGVASRVAFDLNGTDSPMMIKVTNGVDIESDVEISLAGYSNFYSVRIGTTTFSSGALPSNIVLVSDGTDLSVYGDGLFLCNITLPHSDMQTISLYARTNDGSVGLHVTDSYDSYDPGEHVDAIARPHYPISTHGTPVTDGSTALGAYIDGSNGIFEPSIYTKGNTDTVVLGELNAGVGVSINTGGGQVTHGVWESVTFPYKTQVQGVGVEYVTNGVLPDIVWKRKA